VLLLVDSIDNRNRRGVPWCDPTVNANTTWPIWQETDIWAV